MYTVLTPKNSSMETVFLQKRIDYLFLKIYICKLFALDKEEACFMVLETEKCS